MKYDMDFELGCETKKKRILGENNEIQIKTLD